MLADSEKMIHIPAFEVTPVDTTAAGDAFVGALAAGYQFFHNLQELARFASAVGALAVTEKGAQSSLPARKQVEAFLLQHDTELLPGFQAMVRR
jgi:ribokinase